MTRRSWLNRYTPRWDCDSRRRYTLRMNFTKMHGTGNDFIVVEGGSTEADSTNWPEVARETCSRHFGVGADGILVIRPSNDAALRMQIFNPDGSEAEMCGNGIRCVTKYAIERGIVDGSAVRSEAGLPIETLGGLMTVWPQNGTVGGSIDAVRVGMGAPTLEPREIPVAVNGPGPVQDHALEVGGYALSLSFVSMGNPHAVSFIDTPVADFPLETIGPIVENHPLFPERVNFEIVNVQSREAITMRVWERGAGLTMACGTGACAVVVASRIAGLVDDCVSVELPGGSLTIEWDGNMESQVYMTGPARTVYAGQLLVNDRANDRGFGDSP